MFASDHSLGIQPYQKIVGRGDETQGLLWMRVFLRLRDPASCLFNLSFNF